MKIMMIILIAPLLILSLAAEEFSFLLKTDRHDAIYQIGDTIKFNADVACGGKSDFGRKVRYNILCDGKSVSSGTFIVGNEPFEYKKKAEFPGWISMNLILLDEKDERYKDSKTGMPVTAGIGAMVSPELLQDAVACPADFGQFWKQCRAEVDKVPMKPEIQRKWQKTVLRDDKQPFNYEWYIVTIPCAGDKPVSGYLAIPLKAKEKSLPVVVMFHGAGVVSANPLTIGRMASNGCVALEVNAHGIENNREPAFYAALGENELKNYPFRGINDRNSCYFKGMFMRVIRALDFAKTLPEWDGKNLIVYGISQGGAQALVAAALDRDVTLCVAAAPAMCDHSGALANPARKPGWPGFFTVNHGTVSDSEAQKTALYFDCVHFAEFIQAETFLLTGLIDSTCAPTGTYAVYNHLPPKTRKTIIAFPTAGHSVPMTDGLKKIKELCTKK